jgi:ribosomal protein S12 methylthiotransferase
MAETDNVVRYLDVPLQHASASVLKRMARKGSGDEFLRLIKVVRDRLPGVALRTSVIAGFPGETDTDVEVLEDFLLLARFDYVGVFAYSPEEGTAAADMPDQIAGDVRLLRAQRLRDAADRVGFEKAAERVGQTLQVLVEGTEDGDTYGRWRGQAPEVDGVVLLDRDLDPGTLVDVRIVDSAAYDLVGEVM